MCSSRSNKEPLASCRALSQPQNFTVSYIQQGVGDYKVCQETILHLPNQAAYSTTIPTEHFTQKPTFLIDLPGYCSVLRLGMEYPGCQEYPGCHAAILCAVSRIL